MHSRRRDDRASSPSATSTSPTWTASRTRSRTSGSPYLRREAPVCWHEPIPTPTTATASGSFTKYDDVARAVARLADVLVGEVAVASTAAAIMIKRRVGRARRRQHDADDGSAEAHAVPQDRDVGVHAAVLKLFEATIKRRATEIVDAVIEQGRATSSTTSRPSCRCRRSPRSSACRRKTARSCSTGRTRWSAAPTPSTSCRRGRRANAQVEMFTYANELAVEKARPATRRHRRPRSSNAEVDGEQLDELEFDLFFMLLTVAGNETTRNAITHGMLAFFEHPDQWQSAARAPRAARHARSTRSCAGRARSSTSGARSRATPSCGASR